VAGDLVGGGGGCKVWVARAFVFERQTLLIFSGYLAQPILLIIAGNIYLYIAYLFSKNHISTYKHVF